MLHKQVNVFLPYQCNKSESHHIGDLDLRKAVAVLDSSSCDLFSGTFMLNIVFKGALVMTIGYLTSPHPFKISHLE